MDRILGLGARASRLVAASIVVAIVFHASLVGLGVAAMALRDFGEWHRDMRDLVTGVLVRTYDIQQEKTPAPPSPPEAKKDEPGTAARDDPALAKAGPPSLGPDLRAGVRPGGDARGGAVAGEAARAGAVLTRAPEPNEVDLTGHAFISGTAASFAGGVTQVGAKGGPTYDPAARADGAPGGTGTGTATRMGTAPAPQAPRVDRSRPAGLRDRERWQRIDFPVEANTDRVDDAWVTLKIVVDGLGRPSEVVLVQDPGHGFGRHARAFALGQTYDVALDGEGHPIPGVVQARIHFTR